MKALDLANYIVSKCIQDEYPISNLQLQKIMFFIQKDFLQNDLGPAFDERIEAWQLHIINIEVLVECLSLLKMIIIIKFLLN